MSTLVSKGIVSVYLIAMSILDFKTHHVPWWITTPLLVPLLEWHIRYGTWTKLLLPWTLVTVIYVFNIFGAADWRLLLVTLAMYPNREYYMTLIYGTLFLQVIEMFRTHQWGKAFTKPTRHSLQTEGTPAIHIIVIPTLFYLWYVFQGKL